MNPGRLSKLELVYITLAWHPCLDPAVLNSRYGKKIL